MSVFQNDVPFLRNNDEAPNIPPFEPGQAIPMGFASTFFPSSGFSSGLIEDYVMRGNDEIPYELAIKRIKKCREKHPEWFECLEVMEKKAYGKEAK